MYTSSEILNKVNESLAALRYDRKPSSLYEPIEYVLSLGGKRIRPVLMLLGYNLFREEPEKIMMQALGLETYHNYTLLHDDLMDNADLRRGHETVHRRWDANKAILSGDSMLVLAYQRVAQCDDAHLPAVLNLFTETALEIGEGQEYDMSFYRSHLVAGKVPDFSDKESSKQILISQSMCDMLGLKLGDKVEVQIRKKVFPGTVVKKRFYDKHYKK